MEKCNFGNENFENTLRISGEEKLEKTNLIDKHHHNDVLLDINSFSFDNESKLYEKNYYPIPKNLINLDKTIEEEKEETLEPQPEKNVESSILFPIVVNPILIEDEEKEKKNESWADAINENNENDFLKNKQKRKVLTNNADSLLSEIDQRINQNTKEMKDMKRNFKKNKNAKNFHHPSLNIIDLEEVDKSKDSNIFNDIDVFDERIFEDLSIYDQSLFNEKSLVEKKTNENLNNDNFSESQNALIKNFHRNNKDKLENILSIQNQSPKHLDEDIHTKPRKLKELLMSFYNNDKEKLNDKNESPCLIVEGNHSKLELFKNLEKLSDNQKKSSNFLIDDDQSNLKIMNSFNNSKDKLNNSLNNKNELLNISVENNHIKLNEVLKKYYKNSKDKLEKFSKKYISNQTYNDLIEDNHTQNKNNLLLKNRKEKLDELSKNFNESANLLYKNHETKPMEINDNIINDLMDNCLEKNNQTQNIDINQEEYSINIFSTINDIKSWQKNQTGKRKFEEFREEKNLNKNMDVESDMILNKKKSCKKLKEFEFNECIYCLNEIKTKSNYFRLCHNCLDNIDSLKDNFTISLQDQPDKFEYLEKKQKIGKRYQANIPEIIENTKNKNNLCSKFQENRMLQINAGQPFLEDKNFKEFTLKFNQIFGVNIPFIKIRYILMLFNNNVEVCLTQINNDKDSWYRFIKDINI